MPIKRPILCIGSDLAVDKTFIIEGFSPNQRFRPPNALTLASGKGCNVARALKTLGAQPAVLGWAGGHNGRIIRDGMRQIGVRTHFIPISAESRTCLAIYDPLTHSLTEINETNPTIQPAEIEAFWQAYLRLLPAFDLVTLSGRLPPGVPADFYARLIEAAQAAGKPTLLDTYGESLRQAIPARPSLVKVNLAEFSELLGEPLATPEDAAAQALALSQRLSLRVVVTLGEGGMIAAAEGRLLRGEAPAVNAVIAIGSGDAFLAGLANGLARGAAFEDALRLGLAAGAANTLQPGACVFDPHMVQALLPRTAIRPA